MVGKESSTIFCSWGCHGDKGKNIQDPGELEDKLQSVEHPGEHGDIHEHVETMFTSRETGRCAPLSPISASLLLSVQAQPPLLFFYDKYNVV
jgi:hypothetical protein